MYEFIIVGKGMIGASSARYLAESGAAVAVIGPDEPQGDWSTHAGVFGSYYDQGRISRRLDSDWTWARLAERSISQYADIESRSGIQFHYPVSGITVGPTAGGPDSYLGRTMQVARRLQEVDYELLTSESVQNRFPFLTFSADTSLIIERAPAGYINPRSFSQAQLTIGQQQGLTIIREEVVRVEKRRDCMQVQTREGSMHQGQRLLIAAGAYTNSLLERPLVLRPRARTILLAELPTAEAERLATMPTLIVDGVDGILFKDIYVLPPIRYPDGKIYIKLGGDDISPLIASSAAELNKWFKAGGNEGQGEALKQCLLAIIPDLDAVSYHIKPCVTTAGGHRYPYLDQLDERRFVAAAGWGKSAKSSNEIGRLGALVAQEKWDDPEFSQDSFKAVYA